MPTIEELRAAQLESAKKIAAELVSWRNGFAADPALGPKVAETWLQDAIVYLIENGIFVASGDAPREALERFHLGDSWKAFGTVLNWLAATRGEMPWDMFWVDFLAERPAPRDIVLMIAVANALGKTERRLNEKEAIVSAARSSTGGKRGPCHADALALFQSSRGIAKSDADAIEKVRETLRKNSPAFRSIPTAKTVREWLVEAGLIRTNAKP